MAKSLGRSASRPGLPLVASAALPASQQDGPTGSEVPPVAAHVYDVIKQRILKCELRPGSPLREQRLGKEHQVSGLPVRLALTRLATEGLAEQVYNRGYFVTPIRLEDLRDSFELRKIVEPAVAKLAAERAGEDDRRRLVAFRDERLEARAEPHPSRAEEINEDYAFHELLSDAARNRQLSAAVDRFWHQYIRMGYLLGREWELIVGDYDASQRGHAAICNAVIEGDGDTAHRLMLQHCTSAERNLVMVAGPLLQST